MNKEIALELQKRGYNYTEDYEALDVIPFEDVVWEPPSNEQVEQCKNAIYRAIRMHGSLEQAILLQNYDVFIEECDGEIADYTYATYLAFKQLSLPIWYKTVTFSVRDIDLTALDALTTYKTTNYSIFGNPTPGRKFSWRKLNTMKKLIARKNLLSDYNVVVTPLMRGGQCIARFPVLDGAYRVLAASELSLPVYFRFAQYHWEIEGMKRLEQFLENEDCSDFLADGGTFSTN